MGPTQEEIERILQRIGHKTEEVKEAGEDRKTDTR